MILFRDNRISFDIAKCMQCGACIAACSVKALSAVKTNIGLFDIKLDTNACILCRKCEYVCPVETLCNSNIDSESFVNKSRSFLAFANDNSVRAYASSGGVVRTVIKFGLERNIFDAVYTLNSIENYPYAEGKIYFDSIDCVNIPRSIYHPVLTNENLKFKGKIDKMLIVGTSCQLLSAERLLKDKVNHLYKICIFCKQQKTIESTRFISKMASGESCLIDNEHPPRYRGNGWPGDIVINNKSIKWEKAAALPFGRRLWRVPGCKLCPNPFGIDADITVMDPWGIEKESNLGKNLLFCNSYKGEKLLELLGNDIYIENVCKEDVIKSVNIADIKRKQLLIPFYLKRNTSLLYKLAGCLEVFQTYIYEQVLMKLKLPFIVYKIMAHLPDLRNIIRVK